MILHGIDKLEDFTTKHTDSKASINAWRKVIGETNFMHFVALKRTFGKADYVKPYTIFDISGTKYRLITVVNYTNKIVVVKHIFTHPEYDRWSGSIRG